MRVSACLPYLPYLFYISSKDIYKQLWKEQGNRWVRSVSRAVGQLGATPPMAPSFSPSCSPAFSPACSHNTGKHFAQCTKYWPNPPSLRHGHTLKGNDMNHDPVTHNAQSDDPATAQHAYVVLPDKSEHAYVPDEPIAESTKLKRTAMYLEPVSLAFLGAIDEQSAAWHVRRAVAAMELDCASI